MDLNCLVVDDEKLSRSIVNHYIEKTNFLKLQIECPSAIEAANLLQEPDNDIDIIYLDVEMPEMSGMELLQSINHTYEVILTTSGEKYAVKAFENSVTDYLVKPFDYARFLKASVKARNNIQTQNRKNEKQTDIYVKSGSKVVKIELSDILYIEALADYVIFVTDQGKHIVHYTMKGIEKRLPASYFARHPGSRRSRQGRFLRRRLDCVSRGRFRERLLQVSKLRLSSCGHGRHRQLLRRLV